MCLKQGKEGGKLTSQKVTLEMFRMQISLVAMRAREFAVSILGRYCGALCSPVGPVGGSRAPGNTRQDTSSPLRSDYLSPRRLLVGVGTHSVRCDHRLSS